MNRTLRATQYLAFVGLGFSQCIMGPLLPAIRARTPMSDWQAGLVGSGQFIGILVVGILGGRLADRFGKKAFLVTASLVMIAGLGGYLAAAGFWPLFLSSVLTGLGGGGYEVGVNALQADHAEEDSGHAMNFLHAFYGVGAVGGPFAATLSLQSGLGWWPVLLLAAVAPAAVAVLLLSQHVAPGRRAAAEVSGPFTFRPVLWLCGAAFMLYVGVEMSVSVWITTFWSRSAAGSAIPAPLMTAVFWGTLTAGRLVCGKVADRIGHHRFLVLASGSVAVVGVLWLVFPTTAVTLAATILFGLSLAGIYPTAMALVTDAFPGASGRVVGFISVFVAVGGFAFPAGVGRLSDALGIGVLRAMVVVLAVLLLGTVRAMRFPAEVEARG